MESGENTSSHGNVEKSDALYYGVYAPENPDANLNVFQDKLEALKVAKKYKKARFKAFQYYLEAAEFALNGSECPNNNTAAEGLILKNNESYQGVGEKASPFRGPKPQELVQFRKLIEAGNLRRVKQLVLQNPRLLVSSGDTPSILQEGARYNALHIAAQAKHADIAQFILDTISDPEFFKELYGDDNQENAEERCKMLLDLYLNTPNKGLNETPLHFAAKFGAKEVVEVLVSYPQCNKNVKNKHFQTAQDINCTRTNLEGAALRHLKKEMDVYLTDTYYIPVLRSEDNSLPPVIGDPFLPTEPPVLNKDPLSPRLEIHAFAGPMNKKSAEKFRKVWKTPPRSLNFNSPNDKADVPSDIVDLASLKVKDPQKGLERIGKNLANKFDVYWKEYWAFLDCFVDIASEEGLDLLEKYLAERYNRLNQSFARALEESLSDDKANIVSPVTNLCATLSALHLNDSNNGSNDKKNDLDPFTCIDQACFVFCNRITNNILNSLSCDSDDIYKALESEIKQLELLINSYMEDNRFYNVNFQKVHSRLGVLIGQKLMNNIREQDEAIVLSSRIKSILDEISKSIDCFSSDDEGNNHKDEHNKPTIYRKQLICLIHFVLNILNTSFEDKRFLNTNGYSGDNFSTSSKHWNEAETCTCVYHLRKPKTRALPSRSNSFKNSKNGINRLDLDNISRKLSFDEDTHDKSPSSPFFSDENVCDFNFLDELEGESEEEFYTAPSSPINLPDIDNNLDFSDPDVLKYEVYLEGECPTETDKAVYEALKLSGVKLNNDTHPNIYKWHHNINLYSAEVRNSWPSPRCLKCTKSQTPLPKTFIDIPNSSTPSKTWLRITGANSPKALLKTTHSSSNQQKHLS